MWHLDVIRAPLRLGVHQREPGEAGNGTRAAAVQVATSNPAGALHGAAERTRPCARRQYIESCSIRRSAALAQERTRAKAASVLTRVSCRQHTWSCLPPPIGSARHREQRDGHRGAASRERIPRPYCVPVAADGRSCSRQGARKSVCQGHDVPPDAGRRRFERGRRNFFTLYLETADSWRLAAHAWWPPVAVTARPWFAIDSRWRSAGREYLDE
jgi:hypothetical protein